jgi:ribosomal protein L12E/L44/L45/RPP1/RPP2
MKPVTYLLRTGLVVGLLLASGCGKSDDQPTRFDETLGGTSAGAPTGAGSVDRGILRDPAEYKPAPYEPLEGEAPAGGGGAEGPEAEAIRGMLSRVAEAIPDLDFQTVLDACVPEQVAALTGVDEYLDNLDGLRGAVESYMRLISEKAGGSDAEELATLTALLPDLMKSVSNAFSVSVLDEEHAVATFHLDRLEIPEQLRAKLAESMQAVAATAAQMGTAAPAGQPGATPLGDFTPDMLDNLPSLEVPLPLRKVDDAWRFELPFTIEEQHAELIGEGALLLKDLLTDLTQAFGQAETLDEQTAMQIGMQVSGRHMPAIMGWYARAQLAFASLMPAESQPAEQPTEADQGQPEEPEEEAAEEEPSGRGRGRSRRP